MAEQFKDQDYFSVLGELFFGNDAALEKYAKVRHTQYELGLWRYHNLPLGEIDGRAKKYFSERFLKGGRIDKVEPAELSEGFTRLNYAVGQKTDDGTFTGCHGRCLRLINELNGVLAKDGLIVVGNPERFLNYLTFDYTVRRDHEGIPILEKPYFIPIWDFHDEECRKAWREFIKYLRAIKRKMSMQDIQKEISYMLRRSIAADK